MWQLCNPECFLEEEEEEKAGVDNSYSYNRQQVDRILFALQSLISFCQSEGNLEVC